MFSNTDEILVWAKKGAKRKVYRLKCDNNLKEKLVLLFNNGANKLLYDESGGTRAPLRFESNYTIINNDETFLISEFVLPTEIVTAIENPDTLENYKNTDKHGKTADGYDIKAILIGKKSGNGFCIGGQKFSQRQIVVKKNQLNLFISGDLFQEVPEDFSISISEEIDCFYNQQGLAFFKYSDANAVFDISEFYRSATQEEVDQFAESSAFDISNRETFNNSVKSIPLRKKIAKIIDLGTLNNVQLIRQNAEKVEINIPFNASGDKIILPENKKLLKEILAFLAEELYPGMFTNKTYLSNSTRELTQQ